ncbi:L-histidine N(alpha)-methyltransferase [Burkholderia multivorans]|uniref:L-histidine N(alpha)-methyltransferase n=1 Tax=Burkholderia multivorans TaxID=87883 RepID=UPI000CFFA3A9|nr:L-histidine N(alpha)-methyltransferase [Burkholderia multivorans]MBY4793909.1 L-histidine N(alpha)-methyltransferase [Burkholderia multivorans]MDR8760850.1 Histidine N-alpha-methyltransferase [Burkholderia multivorans]MDR8765001.1 Histidine N-alpha-methyltransferase [Burkholderia multivorans]MDR8773034.1 Histidine N-alpha-methyltransferase [Burkholderia multivorans]MDR8790542.1 Histidine N-alpha-methyltransferase [Burkholderia multivorans]
MRETSDLTATTGGQLPAREVRPSAFERDLIDGLSRTPRSIPPKYFYDATGSALFDRICELPEYYPTRTELGILRARAAEIVQRVGPHADIVEFGAGSLEKIRILLDAFAAHGANAPLRYVPIDISADYLHGAAARLRAEYPWLDVAPIAADYTKAEQLAELTATPRRRIGFFPGSTIGNFSPEEADAFLRDAAQLLRGGGLLVGADLVKDERVLHDAYNDAQGVTARFNLNLLARANAELGADFDLDAFSHCAFYDPQRQRIEMHLVSDVAQSVQVRGHVFHFDAGERIHTENSYKFTIDGFRTIARRAGFVPDTVWTDADRLFSVHWLRSVDDIRA